jgi:hypothetical protein
MPFVRRPFFIYPPRVGQAVAGARGPVSMSSTTSVHSQTPRQDRAMAIYAEIRSWLHTCGANRIADSASARYGVDCASVGILISPSRLSLPIPPWPLNTFPLCVPRA